jgi:hypothetical protein
LQRHARAKGYFSPVRFSDRLNDKVAVHELALNPDCFTGRSKVSGWDVPAPPATAQGIDPGASAVPPEEELIGPWDDGTGEVAALQKQFASENPQGTLPQMDKWMRTKARHLFKRRSEFDKILNPLPPLETGVYETTSWKMEGDTLPV